MIVSFLHVSIIAIVMFTPSVRGDISLSDNNYTMPSEGKFFFAQLLYEKAQPYVDIGLGTPD